jgi:IS5 family transposase
MRRHSSPTFYASGPNWRTRSKRLRRRGLEDALSDSQALRDFLGIDLSLDSGPDATTPLKFQRLLPDNDLAKALLDEINANLA